LGLFQNGDDKSDSARLLDEGDRYLRPVRQAVNNRGLFTTGWFDVREKYCFG